MRSVPALLVLFTACSAAPHARESTAPDALALEDVTSWRRWPRANAKRFLSKGHGFLWVDVHIEPEHAGEYAALNVTPPSGFRVIKVGYEKERGGDPLGLTVMAKMPPGYDPENGDWYYGVFAADGKRAATQGKLEPCIACHGNAPKRDHLFGVRDED